MRCIPRIMVMASATAMVCAGPRTSGAKQYRMIEIPSVADAATTCSATLSCRGGVMSFGLNRLGHATGNSSVTPTSPGRAFLFDGAVTHLLGFPVAAPSGFCAVDNSRGQALNDSDIVVGFWGWTSVLSTGGCTAPAGPNSIRSPFRSAVWVPSGEGYVAQDLPTLAAPSTVFRGLGFIESVSRLGSIVAPARDATTFSCGATTLTNQFAPLYAPNLDAGVRLVDLFAHDCAYPNTRINAIADGPDATDTTDQRACGYDETGGNPLPLSGTRAFVVDPNVPGSKQPLLSNWLDAAGHTVIGNTLCVGINEHFVPVGAADYDKPSGCKPGISCHQDATIFTSPSYTDLGTLGTGAHSLAVAVNDRGDVSGWSEIDPTGAARRAFVAYASEGWSVMHDLNDGSVINNPSYVLSEATGINKLKVKDRDGTVIDTGVSEMVVNGFNPGANELSCRRYGFGDGSACHSFLLLPLPGVALTNVPAAVNRAKITISGTVRHEGPVTVVLTLNGAPAGVSIPATEADGSVNATVSFPVKLPVGSNQLELTAVDRANSSATVTATVVRPVDRRVDSDDGD
jgi:uncharacterized membrane protein